MGRWCDRGLGTARWRKGRRAWRWLPLKQGPERLGDRCARCVQAEPPSQSTSCWGDPGMFDLPGEERGIFHSHITLNMLLPRSSMPPFLEHRQSASAGTRPLLRHSPAWRTCSVTSALMSEKSHMAKKLSKHVPSSASCKNESKDRK